MKKVYLAGSFANRDELRKRANDLMSAGFMVTSNWLYWEPDPTMLQSEIEELIGLMDCKCLQEADIVIICTDVPSTKGGFNVELGLALGLCKHVYIFGNRTTWPNGFFNVPEAARIESDWANLLHLLQSVPTYKPKKAVEFNAF